MKFSDTIKIPERTIDAMRDIPSKNLVHAVSALPNKMKFDQSGQIGIKEGTDYSRPAGWRTGMRDEVWNNAKDAHGRVRDPLTGRYMSKDQPWDMGHKPGYEFYKHQESAKERGIDRKTFLDEYYNVDHFRPELPSSNRSHKAEDRTSNYFGD